MDKYNLDQMVRDVAAGNADAYRRLLEASARLVRGYLLAKIGGGPMRADVEDIVQETLLAVHLKYNSYNPALPYLPWLRAVAHHKLVDNVRRRKATGTVPLDEDIAETTAAADEGQDASLSVNTLLAQLPEKQQTIVRLARIDGKSMAEIANETKLSIPAVKVALHRAIKKLGVLAKEKEVHAHG